MSDYSIVNFDCNLWLGKFEGVKWRIFVSAEDAFFFADDVLAPVIVVQELMDADNCSCFVSFCLGWVVGAKADELAWDDEV